MASHFDLTDLQLVVNISNVHSLTRGAERTHLSLPAASNRVKNLEEHFGTRLFHRNSQGVTLTAAGEAFLKHARQVLMQIDQLRGDLHEFASGTKGQIRVLANTTAMTEFMPAVLSRYLTNHQEVNVTLREHLSFEIVKAVSEGSADIGIVAGQPVGVGLEYLPYRKDHLTLVTHPDHPLAKRENISFVDTLEYDYVGLSEWSAIHPFLIKEADLVGVALRFRVEVASFEAVCRMIEARVGIGVVPERAAMRYAGLMNLHTIRLKEQWAERELHICVRDLKQLPAFARDLVDLLLEDVPADEVQPPASATKF
ncbi:LysR substrate-binding domain-containing protein [Orrella sp. 11846]|uniref:LysR substrate-binding domain-containing protein n=1 Tax=Orrella sp. 11846 TaxID=3409913 RepID=UPI003B5A87D3